MGKTLMPTALIILTGTLLDIAHVIAAPAQSAQTTLTIEEVIHIIDRKVESRKSWSTTPASMSPLRVPSRDPQAVSCPCWSPQTGRTRWRRRSNRFPVTCNRRFVQIGFENSQRDDLRMRDSCREIRNVSRFSVAIS